MANCGVLNGLPKFFTDKNITAKRKSVYDYFKYGQNKTSGNQISLT